VAKAKEVHRGIDSLTGLREDLEKILESVDRNYDRNKARVVAAAKAGRLTLAELDAATKRLLHTHKVLAGLDKVMKGWSYLDLTQKAFLADRESEREKARNELVKNLAKETKPYFLDLAKEVGILSKDPAKSIMGRAKTFLVRTLGEKPLLLVEAVDLPLTVICEVLTPTEIGYDLFDIANPHESWTVEEGQELLANELSLPPKQQNVPAIHAAMAGILAKQRDEAIASQKRAATRDKILKQLGSNFGPKW
jgi:hypothetical protein